MTTEPTLTRERVRHGLALRHVTVAAVRDVAPAIRRITLTGPELEGFVSPGPADHVKVFLPDADGVLNTPTIGPDGAPQPPAGPVISRDYTPRAYRPESGELDIDFVVHGDSGPASAWASRAVPGAPLAVAGPRGSHLPPAGVEHAVIVADETGLPAASRWIDAFAAQGVPVTALLFVEDAATSGYLDGTSAADVRWLSGPDRFAQVEEALRGLSFGERDFVFLAGEAGALVPLRHHLRRELGLPREQVDAHGYWRRGVAGLDHHAPIDPADPD